MELPLRASGKETGGGAVGRGAGGEAKALIIHGSIS